MIAFGMRYYDPALGRWTSPDPAGFEDGPNLYGYLHNRPLQSFDRFGLYAESLFGIGGFTYSALESNYEKYCSPLAYGPLFNPIGSSVMHINIEDQLEEKFRLRERPNNTFYRTKTYSMNDFVDPDLKMNYNFPDMPPNKQILFINGICNDLGTFEQSLLHIANMAGYNVQGVFCPTFGKALDPILYKHAKNDVIAYEGTRELQRHIQDFHLKSKPGASMMIIPHSRGAVYARNSMIECGQELRDRVDIRAFAPGGYIDPFLCKSVRHYESARDIVPLFDRSGRERCRDTIVTLQPHLQAPWFDHGFTSPTYEQNLRIEIEQYMRK